MIHLRSDLRVEDLDGEVVVLDRSGEIAHRLTGDAAAALHLLVDGVDPADVPAELADAVDELVRAGLVDDASGWSRRRFVAVGGAGLAAASVTSFLLASPAAAASACPGGVTPSPAQMQYESSGTYTYTTGPGTTSLLVRVWGGGGGGGAGHTEWSGGGGGGGHFVNNTALPVSACAEYQLLVGEGGQGGYEGDEGRASSHNGGTSDFHDTVWAKGGNRGIGGADGTSGDPHPAPGGAATDVNSGGGWTSWSAGGKGGDGWEGSGDLILAGGGGGGGGGGFGGNGGSGADGTSTGGAGGAGGAGSPSGGDGGAGGASELDGVTGAPRGGGGGGGGIFQAIINPDGEAGAGGYGGDGAIWIGI